jgi:membrane protease YdiL (CAAX protease family)
MSLSAQSLISIGFSALVMTSLALWIHAARGGVPPLSRLSRAVPQQPVPWSLVDLAVVLGFLLGVQVCVQSLVLRNLDLQAGFDLMKLEPSARVALVWGASFSTTVGTTLGLLWIRSRYLDGAQRLVGDLSRWKEDLIIGSLAFIMLAPPLLILQLVLTQLFPSKHPLIDLVLNNPEPRYLWASGVAAVIVAPIFEEIQFRVLLQGWLQTVARVEIPVDRWVFGSPTRPGSIGSDLVVSETGTATGTTQASDPATRDGSREAPSTYESKAPAIWPMFVGAFFFAAAHMSHGPDPIPLFFLALGLGWLYRATGRVLPSIVVHFLLNLWTLFVLLATIYGDAT